MRKLHFTFTLSCAGALLVLWKAQ